MRLSVCFALVVSLFAGMAAAEPLTPEKRLVYSRDTDFPGSDIRAIFDTSLAACERACLATEGCQAFTYNEISSACFPKSQAAPAVPFAGALSAVVVSVGPAAEARAAQRAARLERITEADLEAALALAERIGRRHPAGATAAPDLVTAAIAARSAGDLATAYRLVGAATSVSDAPDLWLEYARLALERRAATSDSSDRRRFRDTALAAALNAYLRSVSDPQAATSLLTLASALEAAGRGRDMIPALRLSNDLSPRDDTAGRLEDAIAKYGFRITEHKVEADTAAPRICAIFSEELVQAGTDYDPFVQRATPGLSVSSDGAQICVEGVTHGERYQVTFRQGLPAASGETLSRPVTLTLYVRDRSPSVRFPGRAYVLPAGGTAALPVVTVNVDTVELALRRVSDRNLLRAIQQSYFGRPLAAYEEELFATELAEEIWRGTGSVSRELNRDMTTRLPIGELVEGLRPGIYALQANAPGQDLYERPAATQWFVVSDLGIASMEGTEALHVVVRSLETAQAKPGAKVTLLSRANAVIGEATTDAQGYARFPIGREPALLMVEDGETDLSFLPLTDPAFDLSDRGVEGRRPAPPIDLFLTTDRGAYRAGETIHVTALTRDGKAEALARLPVTTVVTRPDGVEYSRHVSTEDVAGGHVFALPIGATAPRGTWRIAAYVDPDAAPLADTTVLVEDFLPERIDVTLDLPPGPIQADIPTDLTVSARYLFGAPAGDLPVEGEYLIRPTNSLEAWPGYNFGRYDERPEAAFDLLPGSRTEADGSTRLPVLLPVPETDGTPLEARLTVRVSDGGGRPVERSETRAIQPTTPLIGIRPEFDGVVPEGSEAGFNLIALGPDGAETPLQVKWTLNRLETRYQWYSLWGNWNWERTVTRTRVATGTLDLNGRGGITAPVDWGRYELEVERIGTPYAASSVEFYAGWYAPADASATPDTLEVSLDKPAYAPGETARLRVVPRAAGTAMVSVLSNRLIDMKIVEIGAEETTIDIPVTEDWGAGAYVTATLLRPAGSGREPARSLGLAYAPVDPGPRKLAARFEMPPEATPRAPMEVTLAVDGIADGETAYAAIAAVDLGILNLTGFDSPDPEGHYFGQRRLGVGLRDLYGRLIDATSGAMGEIRSGGDQQSANRRQADPPTEELVSFFTGPVEVVDGKVTVAYDLPAFNGTVRLMAVVWSPKGVGQAETDILVRDPVVVTASLPRFLAPGDQTEMLVELVHATGPSGRMGLDISGTGVALGDVPSGVDLGTQERLRLRVPVVAGEAGLAALRVALTTPDGKALVKTLNLPIRVNDPLVARTRRVDLAAGSALTFDADIFAEFRPGTGSATLAAGPLARFDAPGLLAALDRYPYGCTEQITSRALPLLYFDGVARAMGMAEGETLSRRIDEAIEAVLTNQSSSGSFGLWRPSSGDFWLDAYVTDFLGRARDQGYAVPETAFRSALDNLRNRVNYAPDFDRGGQDLAYALYVLAREGAAAMSDLRYYADVKAEALATPLAQAQLGAALAAYGDPTRADRLFALAAARTGAARSGAQVWRSDYGTGLRDTAGLLTLAAEAGSEVVDRNALIRRLSRAGQRSTQEAAWSLLAANALIADHANEGILFNGSPVEGPLVRVIEEEASAPLRLETAADTVVMLTTYGVPSQAEPAGGDGYAIERSYYTLDGEPADPALVAVGTRLATVLTIRPFAEGEARLMVNDPLPAGFEIDNPNLLRGGDVRALDWLDAEASAEMTEARDDRFLAAIDRRSPEPFRLAYIVRAVSPGSYHHPAASVEDMYRPAFRAQTAAGRVEITE